MLLTGATLGARRGALDQWIGLERAAVVPAERQREHRSRDDQFDADRFRNLRAAAVGERIVGDDFAFLARHVGLPAADHQRITLAQQKGIAGIDGLGRIVAAVLAEMKHIESAARAAVDHVIEQRAVALGRVERLDDADIDHVLDAAARIARRFLDEDDAGVARIVGVDFTEGAAGKFFVAPGRAEIAAVESR